jgi:predicted nucleotidyltransferase
MADEKRRQRTSFTRSLQRIAERIDKTSEFEVEWHNEFIRRKEKTKFCVKALWAFGSWAKGASFCGDLDLIVDVEVTEGFLPMTSTIRRVLTKGARDVRLYVGKPEKNDSGVTVEEAVLIWSDSDRNWKKNIADVKPDPTAERFVRKVDDLPLRSEQLCEEIDFLEKLVDLKNEEILDWMWVPISNLNLDSINWSDTAGSFYERLNGHSGKKTREAMRFVIDWFEVNDPVQTWQYDHSSRAAFIINGNYIHIGRPSIGLRRLDHHSCSGLMLVPHFTKRGPNGIWIIRRGIKHKLEKMFRDICVYSLKWKDQSIAIVQAISDWRKINLIDLFRKKTDADLFAREISEEKEPEYYSSEVSGNELLRIISLVDQVEIDGEAYAISLDGTWFDDEEFTRPEPAELKNILARITESKPDE